MIPTHTVPSLSGTFGIPARLLHNPKIPKEPSSPSRSKARIERQLHDMKNQGQRTTANKSHRLCCATGDTNVSRFFVSYQTKLKGMQRLRLLLAKRWA